MKKYKNRLVPTKQGAFIRRRIDKNRFRAELVGMIYLIATLVVSALACDTLMYSDRFSMGVFQFYKVLLAPDFKTVDGIARFTTACLYGVMLLVLLINGLRAFTHLKNLFKKKVSRVYGLNQPIIGTIVLSVFAPFSICILFYCLGFAPVCNKKPWLAYLCVVGLTLIPPIINILWRDEVVLSLCGFLVQLPIHLLACWSYQKTDNVWTPILSLSVTNLMLSIVLSILMLLKIV